MVILAYKFVSHAFVVGVRERGCCFIGKHKIKTSRESLEPTEGVKCLSWLIREMCVGQILGLTMTYFKFNADRFRMLHWQI